MFALCYNNIKLINKGKYFVNIIMANRLNFEFIDLGQRNRDHGQYVNSVWKVTLNGIEGLNFKELLDTQIDNKPKNVNSFGREKVISDESIILKTIENEVK
jgi:hypothetical protein